MQPRIFAVALSAMALTACERDTPAVAPPAPVVTAPATEPAPPPPRAKPAPSLSWIGALYPGAALREGVLSGVARDGIPGVVREQNARWIAVADDRWFGAFLLELQDSTRAGKYLQVILVDADGRFLARPEGFPIGGTWDLHTEEGQEAERELALRDLRSVPGSDRAVLLDYTPTTTAFDSDHYQVFAVDASGGIVAGDPVAHGIRYGGDGSKFTRTFATIAYADGAVRGVVRVEEELVYEDGGDHSPKDEAVVLLTLAP